MSNSHYGSLFDEQNFAAPQQPAQSQPDSQPDQESANLELHGMLVEDVSVQGLTPMDLNVVAKMVNEQMKQLERECFESPAKGGIDTLRLALLAAFHFAAEYYMLQQVSGLSGKANAKRIDAVVESLQRTLDGARE